MSSALLYLGSFAFALPYLAIAANLLHNKLRRVLWRRGKNLPRPDPARCSTSAALGAMLLLGQIFYRPSMAHVAEATEQMDVEEDDSGDPEYPDEKLHRQLRRIRRGEVVGDLVVGP
jgi:hypothetical protein